MTDLTLAHLRLIDAVAQAIAEDYLRSQALSQQDPDQARQNPVPLPATEQAA